MLTLQVPELQPVDQLQLRLNLTDAEGATFSEDIYWTMHAIPAGWPLHGVDEGDRLRHE